MSSAKFAAKTQQALTLFQQGQTQQAQSLLEKITSKDKRNDLAWFLLATIHFQNGQLAQAEKGFVQALNARNNYAEAWNNLGVVREKLNKLDDAAKAYRKSIAINPNYTSALFHLGNLLQQGENYDEASSIYQKALTLDPNHLKVLNNYALILENEKQYDRAAELLGRALQLQPNDVEALNNMGYALRAMGKLEEAMQYFSKAVNIQEDSAKSLINLGINHMDMGNLPQAIQAFKQADQVDPGNAEAVCNLGQCYEQQGDTEQALNLYRKASGLDPQYVSAWNALGALLKRLGREEEAGSMFSKATEIDPTYADTRYNLAVTQLGMKDFEHGFKNYTSRPSRLSLNFATSIEPLEKSLDGKTVLLNRDQGIGDELFFLRFAPQLRQRGARIIYRATDKLIPLLETTDSINEIIGQDDSFPKHDVCLSVGDLPHVLDIKNDDTLPPPLSLSVDDAAKEKMQSKLASLGPPPYIGITWRGGTKKKRVLFKEIDLIDIADVLKDVEGTIIALQRKPESGELASVMRAMGKPVHDLTTLNENLPEMMAALALLDDYIGVSNANMHFRASLGKTARVLVPHPPEWRWTVSGDSSPWFPGFTVYRQSIEGDWQSALSQLAQDLRSEQHAQPVANEQR